MNAVLEAIGKFLSSWKPWVVVAPWEKGVRVRLGKTATQLEPGFHLRIPVLDRVVLINTRLRTVTTSSVSTSSKRIGFATVRRAIVGYLINEPLRALESYNNPQQAICAIAQGAMASGVAQHACREHLRGETDGAGLEIVFVHYSEDVEIRAFRLLQAEWAVDANDQQHGNEPVVRY